MTSLAPAPYNSAFRHLDSCVPIRLLHGTGAAALLGCLAWWLGGHTAPALESAAALRGERYYRLLLDDRHVGYLHTDTRRDRLGRCANPLH